MKTSEDEIRNYHSTMVEHQRRMADFDSKFTVLNQPTMIINEDGDSQFSPAVNPLSIVSSTAKDSAARPILEGPPRTLVLNPIQEEEKSLINNYSHFLQNDPLKPTESLCDDNTILLLNNNKQPPKTAGNAARPPMSSSTRCSQQSRSTQRGQNNSQISKRRAMNDSICGGAEKSGDFVSPYTSV
jgi:hypothetical protein